jgi:hypothetical protein
MKKEEGAWPFVLLGPTWQGGRVEDWPVQTCSSDGLSLVGAQCMGPWL